MDSWSLCSSWNVGVYNVFGYTCHSPCDSTAFGYSGIIPHHIVPSWNYKFQFQMEIEKGRHLAGYYFDQYRLAYCNNTLSSFKDVRKKKDTKAGRQPMLVRPAFYFIKFLFIKSRSGSWSY